MKGLLAVILFVMSFMPGAAYSAAFDSPNICKAVISTVMSQSPKIIKINRVTNGVVFLSYKRPSDGKYWAQKCKIVGSKVIWGSAEGRWRDDPQDSVIHFSMSKDKKRITIQEAHSDGSGSVKSFHEGQI